MPRIAVLLEPMLTCSNPQMFAEEARRLCGMLLKEDGGHALGNMRIICGAPAAARLANGTPAARPYLIQPSSAVQAAFVALAMDWNTHGQREWSAIQAGSAGHERLYESVLLSARTAYPFDVLAYWGANETLRAAAARLGIPMLWAGRGLRQPFAAHFCLGPHGAGSAGKVAPLAAGAPDGHPGLPDVAAAAELLTRLPTAEVRMLGGTRASVGDVWVNGVGRLPLHPNPGEGSVDTAVLEQGASGCALHVEGWGVDPGNGAMLAGVLVTAGTASVWSSACVRRPDVALHYRDPVRLPSGFGVRVPMSQLGAAGDMAVRVFGVTAAGRCVRLLPDWRLDPAAGQFRRVPDGAEGLAGSRLKGAAARAAQDDAAWRRAV